MIEKEVIEKVVIERDAAGRASKVRETHLVPEPPPPPPPPALSVETQASLTVARTVEQLAPLLERGGPVTITLHTGPEVYEEAAKRLKPIIAAFASKWTVVTIKHELPPLPADAIARPAASMPNAPTRAIGFRGD